ncbi:uncharacterized protein LOC142640815 isoform X1 [Castanea sativa]|uniref:uncharacterized protein LOC142640815 isoform X1 n=1 Tax=Castanea sativa TaxID=21020 RepID=UPI003F64BF20
MQRLRPEVIFFQFHLSVLLIRCWRWCYVLGCRAFHSSFRTSQGGLSLNIGSGESCVGSVVRLEREDVKLKQFMEHGQGLVSPQAWSLKVLKQLNLPHNTPILLAKGDIDRVSRPWEILPTGHKIGTPEPLFKELV